MSDINKSFSSLNNDKAVITIQDTGLLAQLPGFFRGKPHFIPYEEIANCTVTENKLSLFLTNKRELVWDDMRQGNAILRAVLHGKNGALSSSQTYLEECKTERKNDIKTAIYLILGWIGLAVLFYILEAIFK